MFRTLIIPALLFTTPAVLIAAPQAQTHELLRMPAGKSVMLWRQVDRRNEAAATTCHPDPTKAFLCHGRSAPATELAAAARPERLSAR